MTAFWIRESVLLRKVESDPKILIFLEENRIHRGVYDLVIKNIIGRGSAYDVKFNLGKKFLNYSNPENYHLSDLGVFSGIRIFPPGKEFRTIFGGQEILNNKDEFPLEIDVFYKTRQKGKTHQRKFSIDPMEYWGLTYFLKD